MPYTIDLATGEMFYKGLPYKVSTSAPTSADVSYAPPYGWLDTTNNEWYVLVDVTSGSATWSSATGMTGPASATDNAVVRFNGTTGQIIQNSGITIDDSHNLNMAASTALQFNSTAILSDSTGTMTLSNIDALDATTESTIEAAIDTLGNLTSASALATIGTVTTGTWSATEIAVAKGGTGQTTYTDGQLLIGNSTGNTLAKATLTGTANQVTVTNGSGTITLSGPQDLAAASSPSFAGLTLTSQLTVANGGTGAQTLTDHGVLVGSGTSAITALSAATNGQLIIGNTGNDPSVAALTGTTNEIDITNGAGSIEIGIASGYAGGSSIVTVGTVTSGTWSATEIAVAKGGTGQTTYTDGQLLIGNSTGNTLAKATLTGTANQVTVTNGSGTITLSTPQDIHTGATPTFAAINLGADNLSDYDEGTWTPVAVGSGTAGSTSYSVQTGTYTRVGNMVTVHFAITTSNTHSGAGNLNITGLPFTSANVSGLKFHGGCSFEVYNFDAPGNWIVAVISANSAVIHFEQITDDGSSNQVDLDTSTTWAVNGSITYQV